MFMVWFLSLLSSTIPLSHYSFLFTKRVLCGAYPCLTKDINSTPEMWIRNIGTYYLVQACGEIILNPIWVKLSPLLLTALHRLMVLDF